MSPTATVRAQGKINLWLSVLAREISGYHSIETMFCRIDLADEISVTLAPPGERTLTCSEALGPAPSNLAYRAAALYCTEREWSTGFHIDVVKHIPAGGGLGGGSADAAAVLRALDALAPRPAGTAELVRIATEIGSDVPFLVSGACAALAWGHGERMLEVGPLAQRHVALLVPDFAISTAEAYASVRIPSTSVPLRLELSALRDWSALALLIRDGVLSNDMERRHRAMRTAISVAATVLTDAGASIAAMTGSGSVVFGIFDHEPDAEALGRASGCQVMLTRTSTDIEAVHCSD